MSNSEKVKRSIILKKQLKRIGIKGLIPVQEKYIFGIETPCSNHLKIIAELKESALIMTAIIDEEISPDETRILSEIGEFMHRVNISLVTGKFELDYDDGSIWFSTSVAYEKTYPETELYHRLVMIIGLMIDKYMPGIIGIVNGLFMPKEAYEKCENTDLVALHLKDHILDLLDRLISECDDKECTNEQNTSVRDTQESVTFSKEFQDLIKRLGYMP